MTRATDELKRAAATRLTLGFATAAPPGAGYHRPGIRRLNKEQCSLMFPIADDLARALRGTEEPIEIASERTRVRVLRLDLQLAVIGNANRNIALTVQ